MDGAGRGTLAGRGIGALSVLLGRALALLGTAPTEEAIANLASWKKCDSLQQSAVDDAVCLVSRRGTPRRDKRQRARRGQLSVLLGRALALLGTAPTEEAIANLASWKKCDSLQQSAIDDAVRIASQRGTLRIATRHATSR